ncbi:hypothetical protein V1515DRAFT_609219 [Lipomyces mesembrius]
MSLQYNALLLLIELFLDAGQISVILFISRPNLSQRVHITYLTCISYRIIPAVSCLTTGAEAFALIVAPSSAMSWDPSAITQSSNPELKMDTMQ